MKNPHKLPPNGKQKRKLVRFLLIGLPAWSRKTAEAGGIST